MTNFHETNVLKNFVRINFCETNVLKKFARINSYETNVLKNFARINFCETNVLKNFARISLSLFIETILESCKRGNYWHKKKEKTTKLTTTFNEVQYYTVRRQLLEIYNVITFCTSKTTY